LSAVDINIYRTPKIQHKLLVYINSHTEKCLMFNKVLTNCRILTFIIPAMLIWGGGAAHENIPCVMARLIEAIIKYHSICMKHNADQYGSRFCLLASGLICVLGTTYTAISRKVLD
jgi:hypothetical protein